MDYKTFTEIYEKSRQEKIQKMRDELEKLEKEESSAGATLRDEVKKIIAELIKPTE
jgi:protein-arginine kinase activator protein McsA